MKYHVFNILALALGALHFADEQTRSGATGTAQYKPAEIFNGLASGWTPSQFREAVPPDVARGLTDENKNTLLHKAIEVGSVDITRMLVNKPYGLDPNLANGVGETAVDMAREKGGEFAGIFKDIGE